MLALPGVDIELPHGGPAFMAALTVHVLGGMTAVAAGIAAAFARKRAGRHPRAGRVFLLALTVVAVSATIMVLIRGRELAHLLAIAIVAATLGWIGRRARRQRRSGWMRWHALGMGGAFIALLTGFYVDNGERLPLWNLLPSWAYWIIPSLVGWPLTLWALRRNERRRRAGHHERVGLA